MKVSFFALLSAVVAGRTTSPSPPGATAIAGPSGPSEPPSWLMKLKYYFKQPQQSEQQILAESFDRYLSTAVVQYRFSSPQDLRAFKEATATLMVDTWFLDAEYGVVCLATSQMISFDRLLPAQLRDTKSVTDADVHRSVVRTFPLHSVELPAHDFANASELFRYMTDYNTVDIGHSWEGRPIRAVLPAEESSTPSDHTRTARSPDRSNHTRTLYVCGIHGREWASTSTCLELMDSLAAGDAVIPLANPDGYHNTFTQDRLWSKNMQPTALSFCPGHDLARGMLGDFDPDATQCSESYCGRGGDTPLEVRAIHSYAKEFERVVYVQGTERTAESKVYSVKEGVVRVSLPDFGSSFLMDSNHLHDAVSRVIGALDGTPHTPL